MDLKEAFEIAMQGEIEGREFYRAIANQTKDKKAKKVFMDLSNDEDMHLHFLRKLYEQYEKNNKIDLPNLPKIREYDDLESPIFTREFKNFVKEKDFEMSALSVGMKLELESSQFYKKIANEVDNKELKEFFLYLSEWEEGHYEALRKQTNFFSDYFKIRYSFFRGF